MSDEKYVYQYPKEELEKLLAQMQSGIVPLVSDDVMEEIKLLQKEMEEETFDDDDPILRNDDQTSVMLRQRMLKAKLEKERRKASTKDVMVIDVSEEQKKMIREQMSVSIVRPDPNKSYNTPDEDLFRNKETKEIHERLKGIKNCYYNQADYMNAMGIIFDAIEFSLGKSGHGEYPWMSYKEAVNQFNSGKIKFGWCAIPKLIINRVTPIGDPEILKGVMNGDVMILNRSDDEDNLRKINKKRNANYKPINVDYNVEGDASYNQMVSAHKAGYDTPWSTAIKYKNTSYDPSAIPFSSIFGISNNNIDQNKPLLFDWSKEGAGEEYYEILHGRKTKSNDIYSLINSNNGNLINPIVSSNMNQFLKSMAVQHNDNSGGYNYNLPNFVQPTENPLKFNEDAATIERQLLASITMNR